MDQALLVTPQGPAGSVADLTARVHQSHQRHPPDTPTLAPPRVVRVTRFGKRYHGRWAVRDVDLDVSAGEIIGLIGPDGAGKSTLLKAMAGVLAYDAGAVEVFGVRVDSERRAERVKDRIGFMPQGLGLNLYAELSVEENIDFFAQLRGLPSGDLRARKERLLEMARLGPFRGRVVKQLSGGMKQKLGLICTLIHEPRLVLLDEPTTGVDPVSRRDFWNLLSELVRQRGMTAVISTAYMDEAARFDRIALVHEGEVVAHGEHDRVLSLVPGSADLEDVFLTLVRRRSGAESADEPPRADTIAPLLTPPLAPPVAAATATAPDRRDVALEARDLVRDFDGFRAVDRVSFRVRAGEIFGLLGANGAGKTTVVKMLTGILVPTAGTGSVAGADMHRAGREIKERIGYMSQAFSLYRDLTVAENIRLYAGIYGVGRRERGPRVAWLLEMTGLTGRERTLAGDLPLGVRQRLALGCALVHRPHVLFLDEPTSGVDPAGRRRFWDILLRLSREDGVAILITTHYMNEAERCDRVALMSGGRLVADAAPDDMKRDVERDIGSLLEVRTDRPTEALHALTRGGVSDAALFGKHVHVLSRDIERDRSRITALLADAGIETRAVARQPLSMEDVFVARVTALERPASTPDPVGASWAAARGGR